MRGDFAEFYCSARMDTTHSQRRVTNCDTVCTTAAASPLADSRLSSSVSVASRDCRLGNGLLGG